MTGSFKANHAVKLYRITKGPWAGCVLAGAGRYAIIQLIRAQVDAGELSGIQSRSDEDDAVVLILGKREAWRIESDTMCPAPIKPPYAVGSGDSFAMGAMLAGTSATEAVKIASKLDVYTGGKIRSITI